MAVCEKKALSAYLHPAPITSDGSMYILTSLWFSLFNHKSLQSWFDPTWDVSG